MATVERTGPHEIGHSGTLRHINPYGQLVPGNLMYQTRYPQAGLNVTLAQILQIRKAFLSGRLNGGQQK